MSIRVSGTHFEGPILGSDRSIKGLYDDAPLGVVDRGRSPYKTWIEDFSECFADAQLETMGWTVTPINTPTAASEEVTGANRHLFLNPGSKVDSGTEIQYNIPGTAASLGNVHQVFGPITASATLLDDKEIFFQVRLGTMSNLAEDGNDGKWLLGFFRTDTTLLGQTTGLPTVAAGGGFGFFKNELGVISAVSTDAAITTQAQCVATGHNVLTLDEASVKEWMVLGARMRIDDASETTGQTDFYINGTKTNTIVNSTCMDAAEEFAFSFAYLNGPVQIQDYGIDYIVTGITRYGLSYPYGRTTSAQTNVF